MTTEAQRLRGLEKEEEEEEAVHAEVAENAESKDKEEVDMLPRAEAWHRTHGLQGLPDYTDRYYFCF
jgi:hypothetical protein